MIIGIPKEIKDHEYRVAITPAGAGELVGNGHRVWVETGAGIGSGFSDEEYRTVGADIVASAADAWSAELVVKVKEPQSTEFEFLRKDLLLFTFLHLAADSNLTQALLESGTTGVAYETVERRSGELPLLTPMSEVAGKMAVQIGAHYLEKRQGGRGVLLGGVPGVRPAEIVILGGGVVGTSAAQVALGMGANVVILDTNRERLRYLEEVLHGRLTTLSSNSYNIAQAIAQADMLIGGVLIKGAKAPRLVTRNMVATMPQGSVVLDIAIDQGGCIETIRPTTHSAPTFLVDGIIHYGVTNIPAAVPRTSTFALSNVTLPYIVKLAKHGFVNMVRSDAGWAKGVNTYNHTITCAPVAEAFGLAYTPLNVK